MAFQKTTSDIKELQAYVAMLERELENVRSVLSTLLEKVPLEPAEKGELASLLEVEPAMEEMKPMKVQYEKTIKQLLDESEGPLDK